jgi:hypothetical protein
VTNGQKVEPIRRLLHRVTVSGGVRPKMLVSHLPPCVAADPMFARIRFPEHRQGSGRTTSSALTVPGKWNEAQQRIDGKNCFLLL